jgi:hypothetical protein
MSAQLTDRRHLETDEVGNRPLLETLRISMFSCPDTELEDCRCGRSPRMLDGERPAQIVGRQLLCVMEAIMSTFDKKRRGRSAADVRRPADPRTRWLLLALQPIRHGPLLIDGCRRRSTASAGRWYSGGKTGAYQMQS